MPGPRVNEGEWWDDGVMDVVTDGLDCWENGRFNYQQPRSAECSTLGEDIILCKDEIIKQTKIFQLREGNIGVIDSSGEYQCNYNHDGSPTRGYYYGDKENITYSGTLSIHM